MDTSDPGRVIPGTVLNVQRKFWGGLWGRQILNSKTVIIALYSFYGSGMSEQNFVEIEVKVHWFESN